MRNRMHQFSAVILTASTISLAACGRGSDANTNAAGGDVSATPSATTTPPAPVVVDTVQTRHHSKLAGAMVGAAAGHMLGGHAVAGAAAGALIQHERNEHRP